MREMPKVELKFVDIESGIIMFNTDSFITTSSRHIKRSGAEIVNAIEDLISEQFQYSIRWTFCNDLIEAIESCMNSDEIVKSNIFMFNQTYCVINAQDHLLEE